MRLLKGLKQGKKNIPASKAVMLDDGEEGEGGGRPPAGLGGAVIYSRDAPDELRGLGTGLVPPGEEDHESLE